ncbi:hypothetical protein GCM10009122_35560 [Fulvivirga kasyanovii]|uniref:Tetratricopeptide repeat protein n=1 Tax=Fulvivirga kasyanovii TaxID=396812 RepID=A0ABW9RIG7_9BACT|nr:hypothetical protein [Fulvivirga kasyanovii]MTI23837.1 hypothetical protein [Fulvivirga kasyanovii]
MKIQAIELEATGKPELLIVAEQLLNQLLSGYPNDNFIKSSSFHTLGNIYKLRNDLETALKYYKEAVDFEKIWPNIKTQADIDFSDLVVKMNKPEYFDLAEELMHKRLEKSLFPLEKYRGYSILAIISQSRGDNTNFERFKKLAEENASKETSGLRYHKDLGTVKKRDSWLDRILKKK